MNFSWFLLKRKNEIYGRPANLCCSFFTSLKKLNAKIKKVKYLKICYVHFKINNYCSINYKFIPSPTTLGTVLG